MSPRAPSASIPAKKRGSGELVLIACVGIILGLLLLPLPTPLLDALLALNITVCLVVLFTVLLTESPRAFTSFPSLLLFLTLYRLGLNVASSRLILLDGDAGKVIEAFGKFVVGGDLVVGVIVFSILVIVQFVVITKGAGRISEVAARFTLDGMPGKQMAIDADLNAGMIDGEQARKRRSELVKETEFYGAMDGASKFVRGDAVAGLIITVVNLIGGLVLGLMEGMDLGEAMHRYSILTIGDGLVAQVPALIVSTAGALLVTKSSSEELLAAELGGQLFANERVFTLVAIAVTILGLMPGLPMLPFLLLGGAVYALARVVSNRKAAAKPPPPPPPAAKPESEQIEDLLATDRLLVEVGYRLVGLVQSGPGGGLLDRIGQLRRRFAQDIGLVLPPIRVRDAASIDARGYRILVNGECVAEGSIHPGCVLAMPPSDRAEPVPGVLTRDPTFGLPAYWVRDDDRDEAELKGYTVIEPSAVLATHLSESIKIHAHDVLSRDDTKSRVDQLKKTSPALVDEVTPSPLGLGDVHRVLKNLLRENVSIKHLAPVFETLADHAARTKDADVLTEFVRERISRSIVNEYTDPKGTLVALTLDPMLEQQVAESANDPNRLGQIVRRVSELTLKAFAEQAKTGKNPVLVVRPTLRRVLALHLLEQKPRVPVLSYNEIASVKRIEPVSVVRMTEETREAVR
ncbi:MAG: flagellar biosynthesis protein FlhA [Planctomycetes bacterium]|nr:flagellar biosynthesis protein FlhA [Planctomycetota bacterium]